MGWHITGSGTGGKRQRSLAPWKISVYVGGKSYRARGRAKQEG